MPHEPQFSALLVTSTHAPFEHRVSPDPQLDWHELPLQTCPVVQLCEQPPQWLASGGTQLPPQSSKPALQRHWPDWQVSPVPQALPQRPQFCWSAVRSLQAVPHMARPPAHGAPTVPPVPGPVDPLPPWPVPTSPRPAQLAKQPIRNDQSRKLCPRKAILTKATIGRASVTRQ